eukprot:1352557-Prymnesium_polylepis.1
MRIEVSGRVQGDKFDLSYACSHGKHALVDFWYHMWGSTIGTLNLKSSGGTTVWSKSGDPPGS